MSISKYLSLFFNKKIIKKLIAYIILLIVFYLLGDFLGLFLLTFIFGYLAISLANFLKIKNDFLISKFFLEIKTREILKKIFSIKFFVIIEYIIFIVIISFLVTKLIPNIISELYYLTINIPELKVYIDEVNSKLEQFKQIKEIGGSLEQILNNKDIFSEKNLDILKNILEQLKAAGGIIVKIFLSLILSFIFIIDLNKLKIYFFTMKKTIFSFFYEEYSLVANTIVHSFGRVFKAQAIIAFVNTTLTVIGLLVIGGIYGMNFPFIYTLAIIVFISGFIPVVGTFISSLPIIIVAITMVHGFDAGFLVLGLILFIHAIEAYYLNPKILSSFMKMPLSLTFLILIISEHLMGIVGLIVGVSLFNFFEELFKDIDKITKKQLKK